MNKIIHQIFLDIGLGPIEDHPIYMDSIHTNITMNPDWEYKLWTDKDVDKLIEEQSETIRDMVKDFPTRMFLCDFIRPIILKKYGGIYMDLDVCCKVPLSSLIQDDNLFIVGRDMKEVPKMCNNVISLPHEYYQLLIDYYLVEYYYKKGMSIYKTWKGRFLLQSVGAYAFLRFLKIHGFKENIFMSWDLYFTDYGTKAWVGRC
tara:strand:- start:338 stop:946 length:609 start_codon:yes stop_codon:yes gene_type:complete